jgi:hypothetical protein
MTTKHGVVKKVEINKNRDSISYNVYSRKYYNNVSELE